MCNCICVLVGWGAGVKGRAVVLILRGRSTMFRSRNPRSLTDLFQISSILVLVSLSVAKKNSLQDVVYFKRYILREIN